MRSRGCVLQVRSLVLPSGGHGVKHRMPAQSSYHRRDRCKCNSRAAARRTVIRWQRRVSSLLHLIGGRECDRSEHAAARGTRLSGGHRTEEASSCWLWQPIPRVARHRRALEESGRRKWCRRKDRKKLAVALVLEA
ncbi:uncharacterized protein LOC125946439 [Dermacentor silvarum]|uniref:uncharacterized protein LOC125946439 n=1 Tax=Dermacentor silvarum TaxID=543639 RepID=UPI002101D380|nr:uncharacterized protein LOC125946439 [Dermacentor silvarum]